MTTDPASMLLRSAMYVPATNERALAKVATLPCDAVIYDLEDAVAPDAKEAARAQLRRTLATPHDPRRRTVVRVNPVDSAEFDADMALVAQTRPGAVLLPKVGSPADVAALGAAAAGHRVDNGLRLWLMIETVEGLSALDAIVRAALAGRPALDCLVVGTNDIAKETGVFDGDERRYLLPWLMDVVRVAKRHRVAVLDGVWNDFADRAGFEREVQQSARMAFDGKTLIHPSQIDAANRAFAPSDAEIDAAQRIVDAFALAENQRAGAINLGGRMVERLHLAQAERLLARRDAAG